MRPASVGIALITISAIAFLVVGLGDLLLPGPIRSIAGIGLEVSTDLLTRTQGVALLTMAGVLWAARSFPRRGQRLVLASLAFYFVVGSAVDLWAFAGGIVGGATIPSAIVRISLGLACLGVALVPERATTDANAAGSTALPSRTTQRTIQDLRAIEGPHPAPRRSAELRGVGMSEETPISSAESPADVGGESPTPEWGPNGANGENETHVEATEAAFTDADAEASASAGATPGGVPEPDQPAAPDDGAAFLANLASAMKEAATAERTRATEDVDRRRESHLAGIETRRESEAGRIRQLADDDRNAIQAWVASEQQRIDQERDRRLTAVESDLEASLAEHGARIDAEKAQVEAAVASHRAELDAYFGKLEGETDPVAIAQQAGRRPAFPDLDAVGAEAASPGAPDRMIGVMASSRPTTKLSQAWAAWNASNATADANATDTAPGSAAVTPPAAVDPGVNPVDPSPAPSPEPVAVGAGAETNAEAASTDPAGEGQPQSSFGGMSWLRRDKGNDQSK